MSAAGVRVYAWHRVRGLASWNPQTKTRTLLDQIKAILEEYAEHLPLTCRQILYRLVGAYLYEKTEAAYDRLLETINRARRSGIIPFDAIRDDGAVENAPSGFSGLPGFFDSVRRAAEDYTRNRMEGQPVATEVWLEAGGMVPQAVRVAHHYGVAVYSSGGFDSTTVKYDAAQRFLAREKPTVVLHAGDFDPSGLSIFDSAAADISQMVADLAGVDQVGGLVTFKRIIVTPEQIEKYGLPEAPPKATDRRGNWIGGTVQAEALAPDDLALELRQAIEAVVNLDVLTETLKTEAAERRRLLKRLKAENWS
jgi:hypothetical protein